MNELELCNVSVRTVPLHEVIPAAAAAGFTVVSIEARAHSRCGMSNAELAKLLADHGMRVQEVEGTFDWLELPAPGDEWLNPVYGTDELLDVGSALGATTLVAIHFGPPHPPEAAAAAFARLCDRAAEHGMRVALEYPAIATISDLASAWQIVNDAGRPNGGLLVDIWHHRRSQSDDALLDQIPAERIFSMQLNDGAREPEGTLLEDLRHRRLPGDGDFGVAAFTHRLLSRGVSCPIGIEVFDPALLDCGVTGALQVLHDSLASVVDDAS